MLKYIFIDTIVWSGHLYNVNNKFDHTGWDLSRTVDLYTVLGICIDVLYECYGLLWKWVCWCTCPTQEQEQKRTMKSN